MAKQPAKSGTVEPHASVEHGAVTPMVAPSTANSKHVVALTAPIAVSLRTARGGDTYAASELLEKVLWTRMSG